MLYFTSEPSNHGLPLTISANHSHVFSLDVLFKPPEQSCPTEFLSAQLLQLFLSPAEGKKRSISCLFPLPVVVFPSHSALPVLSLPVFSFLELGSEDPNFGWVGGSVPFPFFSVTNFKIFFYSVYFIHSMVHFIVFIIVLLSRIFLPLTRALIA